MGLVGLSGAGSLTRLKSADAATELISSSDSLIGIFREPTGASAMFNVFAEVAGDLPSYVDSPVKSAFSAAYKDDPIAAAFGIKSIPAVLFFKKGATEPVSMPIPRNKKEFTEDAIAE